MRSPAWFNMRRRNSFFAEVTRHTQSFVLFEWQNKPKGVEKTNFSFEAEADDPSQLHLFFALVLKGSIRQMEDIRKAIKESKAQIVYQKCSGDYLFITNRAPPGKDETRKEAEKR